MCNHEMAKLSSLMCTLSVIFGDYSSQLKYIIISDFFGKNTESSLLAIPRICYVGVQRADHTEQLTTACYSVPGGSTLSSGFIG